jgi:hypothetical protein
MVVPKVVENKISHDTTVESVFKDKHKQRLNSLFATLGAIEDAISFFESTN